MLFCLVRISFLAQKLSYGVLVLICLYIYIMQLTMIASCGVQVLPSIWEKHGETFLREFQKRWANHKVMVRWLSHFFHYLDRFFIT
jgi:hypothetical protein